MADQRSDERKEVTMMMPPPSSFAPGISKLLREIDVLLGPTVKQLRAKERRITSAPNPAERHRLLWLIDEAAKTLKAPPPGVINSYALAELTTVAHVVKVWRNDAHWRTIESSLVNSADFAHTISLLRLAEYFIQTGQETTLIPTTNESPTPDLRVKTIEGMPRWVSIECYQPQVFNGMVQDGLTPKQVERIVKETMKKAKDQIGGEMGVMAVCGYNQPDGNIKAVSDAFEARLLNTNKTSLMGVIIQNMWLLFQASPGGPIRISHMGMVLFLPNPNFAGDTTISIPLVTRIPRSHPSWV
jgi:hypothetical protein